FSRDPFRRDADRPFERQRRRQKRHPPRLYLEAEASPLNPTVGQQVTYTLYVYYDVNVRNATPGKLPDFKGFWSLVIPQPERTRQERLVRDGREIYRAVLFERALFPRRSGRLEIEPVEQTLTALIPDPSPFGSLMPKMRELKSTSNPVTIDVRPLPEPQPEGFAGLVGRMRLQLEADRAELEVGEAVTLTLRLAGEGHFQGAQAPTLGEIPGFQIMPPQELSNEFLDGTTVRGEREFSYVLLPRRPGSFEIPALEIPYFDPKAGEYRVASAPSVPLEVAGSSSLVATGSREVTLHTVRTANLPVARRARDQIKNALRHALVLIPLTLGLLLLLRDHRSDAVRSGRSRIRHALDLARKEERPRQAAALIEDAWRLYLEERWQIPKGTPSSKWVVMLTRKGIDQAVAQELVSVGDDLHYLRYAPKLSQTSELRSELVERSRRLLKEL
ncbi:MAG: BatD family protein, partial [Acidobacteriota bacterium]